MILLYIAIYIYLGFLCLEITRTVSTVSDFVYAKEKWPTREEFYEYYEEGYWDGCEGLAIAVVLAWPITMFLFAMLLVVIHAAEFIDRVDVERIKRPIRKLKILFTFPKHVIGMFLRK